MQWEAETEVYITIKRLLDFEENIRHSITISAKLSAPLMCDLHTFNLLNLNVNVVHLQVPK